MFVVLCVMPLSDCLSRSDVKGARSLAGMLMVEAVDPMLMRRLRPTSWNRSGGAVVFNRDEPVGLSARRARSPASPVLPTPQSDGGLSVGKPAVRLRHGASHPYATRC